MAKHDSIPVSEILNSADDIEDNLQKALLVGEMLAQAQTLQQGLKVIRQEAVVRLNEEGWSFEEIASQLGMTKPRAHQIALGHKPGKPKN